MDQFIEATPSEVVDIYRDGQRRGFIAGIVFCVAAKYLYDRRREIPTKDEDTRWRN